MAWLDSYGVSGAATKEVLSFGSGVTRIRYTTGEVGFVDSPFEKAGFMRPEAPGTGFVSQAGAPMLIREGLFVALPGDGEFTGVKAKIIEEREEAGYDILPVPKPVLEPSHSDFERDGDIYGSDDIWPGVSAQYIKTVVIDGIQCAHILVNPVRYRPKSKLTLIASAIEIEVSYCGDAPVVPLVEAFKPPEEEKPRFIIVTTKELEYGTRVFEGVKKFRYDAETVMLEDILNRYPQAEDAVMAIKTFLFDEHARKKVDYVLLAGDCDKIPAPLLSYCGSAASDNFYCTEGSCLIPVFKLSRMPASNADELFRMLNVASYYFRYQDEKRSKVCMAADLDDAAYKQCKEEIAQLIAERFPLVKHYGGEAEKDGLIAAIEDGVGFINYRGRGEEDSWTAFGLDSADVKALNVGNCTPVVFSVACSTAAIHGQGDCFGAVWMKELKSVAYVGASTETYMMANDDFDRYIWTAVNTHGLSRVGDIFCWAVSELYRNGVTEEVYHNIRIYLQLGDPTADFLEVRP